MAQRFEKILTPGVLEKMRVGVVDGLNPVLQIVGIKTVTGNPNNPEQANRYRIVVSDGIETQSFVMLATTLNFMFENGDINENCIIAIHRQVPSRISRDGTNDRNVYIVFELSVLHKGEEVGGVIKIKNAPQSAAKENINTNAAPSNSTLFGSKGDSHKANNETSYDTSSHLTIPIDALSPYQNQWTIKARITSKSPIRTWSNQRGEGKLFSFDLCDETGEIRVTAFKDMVDKWYNTLEVDKVYYISKCQIKPANKQYSKLKNDYEMTVGSDTQIQLCNEDTMSIPKLRYDFISIAEIADKSADSAVDIIGIVKEASEATKLVSRTTNRELVKRDITLVDRSNASIVLTIWGDEAENFRNTNNPVILVKGGLIKEYGGGKTLGTGSGTVMKINPDIPECHQLRGWFENEGSTENFNTLSGKNAMGVGMNTEWLTFREMKDKHLGSGEKPDYFQLVGMVHKIKDTNMLYKACAQGDCNKKVVENDDGTYRCDKCNIDSPNYRNRLLTNVMIGDWTSNRWVTLFADVAEYVIGKNADEVAELLEDPKAAESYFSERQFKPLLFKMRTKIETYGDVPRPKTSAVSVAPVPTKEYNQMLWKNIQLLTGIRKTE